jgi:hypothetical protein
MTISEEIVELRESNRRFRLELDALSTHCIEDSQAAVAQPEQIATLLTELRRFGQTLQEKSAGIDLGLDHELTEFRTQVERLRDLLPTIHILLLRERGRLEQERNRMNLASEWIHRSSQTF